MACIKKQSSKKRLFFVFKTLTNGWLNAMFVYHSFTIYWGINAIILSLNINEKRKKRRVEMKKRELTIVDLKLLMVALFNMQQAKQAKLQECIQRALGNKVQQERPAVIAIRNKLVEAVSSILARRLKTSRRNTSLFSSRDFAKIIPSIFEAIEHAEDIELNEEERGMLEEMMREEVKNTLEVMAEFMWSYEDYWRWVKIVMDVASERRVPTLEIFKLEGVYDEIMRRLFSRKELTALYKRAVSKFMRVDTMKKIVIQPMLKSLITDADAKERRNLKRELEAEFMPELRNIIKKSKEVFKIWLNEEIVRIYT